jgi:hypothetical protein
MMTEGCWDEDVLQLDEPNGSSKTFDFVADRPTSMKLARWVDLQTVQKNIEEVANSEEIGRTSEAARTRGPGFR